jgi:hypothetical protein
MVDVAAEIRSRYPCITAWAISLLVNGRIVCLPQVMILEKLPAPITGTARGMGRRANLRSHRFGLCLLITITTHYEWTHCFPPEVYLCWDLCNCGFLGLPIHRVEVTQRFGINFSRNSRCKWRTRKLRSYIHVIIIVSTVLCGPWPSPEASASLLCS